MVLTYNDSRQVLTRLAKFEEIVSVNDLVCLSAPGTSVGSSTFSEKFLFYMGMIVSTELPNLVPQQRSDDCVGIRILH